MKKIVAFLKKYPLVLVEKHRKNFHKPLNETAMCCPFCGHPLVRRGEKRLQTLCEHVCDPNSTPSFKPAYYCENPDCEMGKIYLWNGSLVWEGDAGEAYTRQDCFEKGEDGHFKWKESALETYHKSHDWYISASNTIALQVEMGSSWNIYLHPALLLGFYRPFIEVTPHATKDGRITGHSFRFHLLRKEEKWSSDYNILHIPGIHMLFFDIKERKRRSLRRLKADIKKGPVKDAVELKTLEKNMKQTFGNDGVRRCYWKKMDWWRGTAEKWMRFFYRKTFDRAKGVLEQSYKDIRGDAMGASSFGTFMRELYTY